MRAGANLPLGRFHRLGNRHRFNAHPLYAHQQVDDFLFVIGEAISVEFFADGRVFRLLFLILVRDPFKAAKTKSIAL